jgi:hypothetical protein
MALAQQRLQVAITPLPGLSAPYFTLLALSQLHQTLALSLFYQSLTEPKLIAIGSALDASASLSSPQIGMIFSPFLFIGVFRSLIIV